MTAWPSVWEKQLVPGQFLMDRYPQHKAKQWAQFAPSMAISVEKPWVAMEPALFSNSLQLWNEALAGEGVTHAWTGLICSC